MNTEETQAKNASCVTKPNVTCEFEKRRCLFRSLAEWKLVRATPRSLEKCNKKKKKKRAETSEEKSANKSKFKHSHSETLDDLAMGVTRDLYENGVFRRAVPLFPDAPAKLRPSLKR
ncbi:hypothetical protein NPIL_634651 [Nephila pilipes]|uniref:Uncharacterized protein n=1 Tax=Nephila pilipes TaxID=299642 RepID=A0A8X6QMZ1_NEPPI|nr:hypothetical protein NPIL_634651 [Nephila pilipes]